MSPSLHHSIYSHRRKLFSLFPITPNGGKHFKLSEQTKSNIYSIFITWNSLDWLSSSFKSLHKEPCNQKFFRKLNEEGDTLWLEKYNNKHGYFAELTLLEQFGLRSNILIPAMEDKRGWFSFFSLISDYSNKNLQSNKTISYSEAVKLKSPPQIQQQQTAPPRQHCAIPIPYSDWLAMVIVHDKRHLVEDTFNSSSNHLT